MFSLKVHIKIIIVKKPKGKIQAKQNAKLPKKNVDKRKTNKTSTQNSPIVKMGFNSKAKM